jgi:MbtH protein
MEIEAKHSVAQEEPQEMYYVVKNIEEQYSIWPSYKQIPKGWVAIGGPRVKPECLAYIDEIWTDMRPLSLRKQMEAIAAH